MQPWPPCRPNGPCCTTWPGLHVIADVPEHSQRALAAGLIRCEEVGTSLGPSKLTAADALREAEERVPGAGGLGP